jgi:sigma-B regulation protein RsbU (phosphoserine phosphatase)
MEPQKTPGADELQENFEDFFEEALCGFVIADAQGMMVRVNAKVLEWTGHTADELKGKKFSELLTMGGKIYYETHLWPLLRMQSYFDEVVLELGSNKAEKLKVMVNAFERRDANSKPLFIRYTILKASDRLQYEQNLQQAKTIAEQELLKQTENVALREQLIAVLGHDLRNPLAAVKMATDLLSTSLTGDVNAELISMLKKSGRRMTELVSNIMDFARTRLGEGILLTRSDTVLDEVLHQVVAELNLAHPDREIITTVELTGSVNCDPFRISQLLSNLIANALTHGAADKPVHIHADGTGENFEISVSNAGVPIPEDMHEHLFVPFTREARRPSQHGLGLGLYIASEIAKAHGGTLSFTSNTEETRFILQMHS